MESYSIKTIYLIRHGQSEENVKINLAQNGINRIKKFSLPERKSVSAAFNLLGLHTGNILKF